MLTKHRERHQPPAASRVPTTKVQAIASQTMSTPRPRNQM